MPFVKGQSGNPSGRPKENPEVKALAREYTVEAIERLGDWMRSDNAKASVGAAIQLLNRAWGTPVNAVQLSGDEDNPITVNNSPRDTARAIMDILRLAQIEGDTGQ